MHGAPQPSTPATVIGRYAIYDAIASGGMATVHLGRLVGPAGFSRTVAIKKLHPQLAEDPDVAPMLLDEARLAARIQHPNVVPTLDVVVADRQMILVMEYVRGDSLSRLLQASRLANRRLPPNVVVAIMINALAGLHAAHEATDERGAPMHLIHRDVSPQNIMVGVDGIARVLDFGIAKATGRLQHTRGDEVKGKVLYMSREQLAGDPLTRAADIYAAGIILFETLTSTRMFSGDNDAAAISRIVANDIRVPSQIDPALAPFDKIVWGASGGALQGRFPTAREMARHLEALCVPASATVVGEWVQSLAGERLDERARLVAEIERSNTHARAVFAGMQHEESTTGPRAPTSGVVQTRGPMPSSPSFVGPMPMPVAHHAPAAPVPAAPARGSGMLIAFAILIGLLLAGVGLGAVAVVTRRVKPAPVTEAPPALVATGTPAAEPAPAPTAEPAAPVEPVVASAALAPSAAPKPVLKAKPRCDPPYTLDSNGHKHFIPECVQ